MEKHLNILKQIHSLRDELSLLQSTILIAHLSNGVNTKLFSENCTSNWYEPYTTDKEFKNLPEGICYFDESIKGEYFDDRNDELLLVAKDLETLKEFVNKHKFVGYATLNYIQYWFE